MKKKLFGVVSSLSLAAALTGGLSTSVQAQDAAPTAKSADDGGVVVVTGIRKSLRANADIKRLSSGVVDAITADDIGKFPDTNLAESLQRIPGVSIDRANNEGSRVTVRGFGPDYNLVTLNGRQMPGAISGATAAPATRSFDFANLASESISGVDVYKTGRADTPSGGIGSTINIKTARPFDYKGRKAAFTLKGIADTSVKTGSKVTPEVSGLFSDTFADGKFGILVNGSYSKRDSREQNAQTDGWLLNVPLVGAQNVTNNNTNPGGNHWAPRNLKFDISDHERTRTNAQAVLQFRPVENLTATLDYTYSLFEDEVTRNQFGVWFNYGGAITKATIDKNGTFTNLEENGGDYSQFGYTDNFRNENKSVGLNLKWDATDNLTLTFDGHSSSAEAGGADDGNNAFIIMGQNVKSKTYNVGNTDIPVVTIAYNGGATELHPSDIDSLLAIANSSSYRTDLDQYQLNGVWRNRDDNGLRSIKFGIAQTKMVSRSTFANSFFPTGFYGGNQSQFDDNLFTRHGTSGFFSEFSGGGASLPPYYYAYDPATVIKRSETVFNYTFAPGPVDADHTIREDTKSAFVSFDFAADFNGMPFRALGGVRYEKTDVRAKSLQTLPVSVRWDNPTEFFTNFSATQSFTDVRSSYDEFLPSLDTSLEIRHNLIARFSYSKTITRADLGAMRGTFDVTPTPKTASRNASQGNPALLPYTSNNIDLSAEWYYSKDSYVALGYFTKSVDNFLTQTTTTGPLFGLTDPFHGPRSNAARAELALANIPASQENVYNQMVIDSGGQTSFVGTAQDDLIVWSITKSSNAEHVTISGWEAAVQHAIGDTGFGFQANVTLVNGGAKFQPAVVGNQFALPGLSNSYNLVGYYDKNGIQARVAYNWRDSFLLAIGQQEAAGEPQNVEAYGQLDASASYDLNSNMSLFVEGLNITNSTQRVYGRYENQLVNARQYGPRYQFGMRYKF